MPASDKLSRRFRRGPVGWLLAFVFLLSAWAARDAHAAVIDRKDVEAFADRVIPQQLVEYHVPGAAFVFVKDGQVLFAKGYGVADVEDRKPFDPDRTVFPIGSLSKPVTATAVMQLYERAKIKLDADVNLYLKSMQLDEIGGRAVTMHDLLTHSAGFDPIYVDIAARDPEQLQQLGSYLPKHVPPRVKPGGVANYSNFGYALAGLVLEDVCGQPFDRYMASHVFEPLHMSNSTFNAAYAQARGNQATGYDWRDGRYVPVPALYVHETPSAGMMSTANDMA